MCSACHSASADSRVAIVSRRGAGGLVMTRERLEDGGWTRGANASRRVALLRILACALAGAGGSMAPAGGAVRHAASLQSSHSPGTSPPTLPRARGTGSRSSSSSIATTALIASARSRSSWCRCRRSGRGASARSSARSRSTSRCRWSTSTAARRRTVSLAARYRVSLHADGRRGRRRREGRRGPRRRAADRGLLCRVPGERDRSRRTKLGASG